MPETSPPKIQSVTVRALRVPMSEPHRTASGTITESPRVLTDVVTDSGVTGHGLVFTYSTAALLPTAGLVQNMAPLIEGEALAPLELEQQLARRFRLLATQGLVGMALAGLLTGVMLNLSGFAVELATQSERTLFLLRLFDVGVPLVTSALAIAIMFTYPISERRAYEIRAELEARRGKLGSDAA